MKRYIFTETNPIELEYFPQYKMFCLTINGQKAWINPLQLFTNIEEIRKLYERSQTRK